MDTAVPGYSHTQKAPLSLILYGIAISYLIWAWWLENVPLVAPLSIGIGVVIIAVAPAFHHLTVVDQGERLAIRFGLLPLFRRTVRYAEIEKVEIGRTLVLDGWVIHYSIRGVWVWNLWGRDCVVVHFKNGGVLRIGTNDGENLVGFLKGRIAQEGK